LQASLDALSDVQNQISSYLEQLQTAHAERDHLQGELTTASDYINEVESKFLQSRQECLELLKKLKEVEQKFQDQQVTIDNLQSYIIDLKSRIAVYIPVKNDKIDKKIAEYINNYPERQKLKIMFMRESEGVYQFGSKRVMVRIDQDKINIRVGGGFLSIDEFLDQYTPEELNRLERKDPSKRFTHKIQVEKTLTGHGVRETSGSPPRTAKNKTDSPMRTTKKIAI
jgi:flagellar biosynthesis chaperone FliJ